MLGLPPVGLGVIQHNLAATPANVPGTLLTASGTSHVKGAWASLIDPLTFDVYWITLLFNNSFNAATDTAQLCDIGVGPTGGGTEQVVLPNLLVGHTGSVNVWGFCSCVSLPMYVQAGKRISARIQALIVSDTISVLCHVWGGPTSPPWAVFQGADAYGPVTATSRGAPITAGNTGAESARTSIGGTTSRAYDAVFPMIQGASAITVYNAMSYHWEYGYSSVTMGEYFAHTTTGEVTYLWPPHPMYGPIASGTQLQGMGEASGTAQALDHALYGLY